MVQKHHAKISQETVRNVLVILLVLKHLAEIDNVQIWLQLLVIVNVTISYLDVYSTVLDVFIKVLLAVHIRELKQLVKGLREVLQPNIVGEPVQQL